LSVALSVASLFERVSITIYDRPLRTPTLHCTSGVCVWLTGNPVGRRAGRS